MKAYDYLKTVAEDGRAEAALSAEEVQKIRDYHGVNSFQGLYYDIACIYCAEKEGKPYRIRPHILDKALDRLDTRFDCADFVVPSLLCLLRYWRGTQYLPEEDAARIIKSLLNFKYWIDEPGEVHACYFTENHQILYASAEYFAGGLLENEVFPNNGMTGREHRAHAKAFLYRWLTWRLRFGFAEWLCQGYYLDDILGLVNLMAFADEEDLREKARAVIDLLVLDLSVHGFRGHLPVTHGRVYTDFIIEPDHEDCSQLMRFLFDEGSREGLCGGAVLLAVNGYECPEAMRSVYASPVSTDIMERMSMDTADAKSFGVDPEDFDNIMFFWGMQTYSDRLCIDNSLKVFPEWNWMVNRMRAYKERYDLCDEAGVPCPDAPDFTAMTQADIYTRRTKDYILSCVQDFRKGRMGYQQHPWTASLGGRAVIFTTNPASLEYGNRPNRWAGNLTLPRCGQTGNVMLCLYRVMPDFVDYLNSHLYFPTHEMDEVREEKGFIFGRKGKGYIAVTSLNPGYWEEKDEALFTHVYREKGHEMFEKAGRYEYTVQGHANVWAIEMGSEEENVSFDRFVSAFTEHAVTGDTHSCTYISPSKGTVTFGWCKPLSVNGVEQPLHRYPRYASPWVNAPFDGKEIRVKGETEDHIIRCE